jgi:ATP-dependent RNA helicase DeaD
MDNLFDELGLKDSLIEALKKVNITEPTEIQKVAIPAALENKDIIGQSRTGSGKTLSYLLPLFSKIDPDKREMQALILAPTHELVMQIFKEINSLSDNSGINIICASIIGDVNVTRQIEKLKEKPHIIVGSTGRILELIKKKKISAHTIKTIVIDEGDRLLDTNNVDNVKSIIKSTLKERQLMLFSATISEKTIKTAKELMKEPQIIRVEEMDEVNPDITHSFFLCERRDKFEVLRKLVHALNLKRAIVFINKSDEIDITTEKLKYHKLKAASILGSNEKEDRKKAMEDFRNGDLQLLVASDIAARGLDIKGVTHIINLDIPEDPKDYLHRVGRTGRAGEKGMAISISTERELDFLKKIQNTYRITIQQKDIYKGRVNDINI